MSVSEGALILKAFADNVSIVLVQSAAVVQMIIMFMLVIIIIIIRMTMFMVLSS